MDLLNYIEGTRRTRSTKQIDREPVMESLSQFLLANSVVPVIDAEYIYGAVKDALINQNAVANAAFGLVGEVYEFLEYVDRQSWFELEYEEQLTDEIGDCWYYVSTLIDTLPMEMTLEDRIEMFFKYYNDGPIQELEMTYMDYLQNVASMGKKIVAHGIDPNAEYKDSGVSFNQIFMRHLADLMRDLLGEINRYLHIESQYTLADIWEQNLGKLEGRHPKGFDGSYNYDKPEFELLPRLQIDSLSSDTGDIFYFDDGVKLPSQGEDWKRDVFP